MKGDNAEWFLDRDQRTGKTIRRVWRRVLIDPTLGVKKGSVRRHLPLRSDNLRIFEVGTDGRVGEIRERASEAPLREHHAYSAFAGTQLFNRILFHQQLLRPITP